MYDYLYMSVCLCVSVSVKKICVCVCVYIQMQVTHPYAANPHIVSVFVCGWMGVKNSDIFIFKRF